MNIRLNYLYRDAGNYKNFKDVVFKNPEKENLDILNERIRASLIDEMNFVAADIRLPECFFDEPNDDDHNWHEFDSLEETDDAPSDEHGRSISEFIEEVKMACEKVVRLLS